MHRTYTSVPSRPRTSRREIPVAFYNTAWGREQAREARREDNHRSSLSHLDVLSTPEHSAEMISRLKRFRENDRDSTRDVTERSDTIKIFPDYQERLREKVLKRSMVKVGMPPRRTVPGAGDLRALELDRRNVAESVQRPLPHLPVNRVYGYTSPEGCDAAGGVNLHSTKEPTKEVLLLHRDIHELPADVPSQHAYKHPFFQEIELIDKYLWTDSESLTSSSSTVRPQTPIRRNIDTVVWPSPPESEREIYRHKPLPPLPPQATGSQLPRSTSFKSTNPQPHQAISFMPRTSLHDLAHRTRTEATSLARKTSFGDQRTSLAKTGTHGPKCAVLPPLQTISRRRTADAVTAPREKRESYEAPIIAPRPSPQGRRPFLLSQPSDLWFADSPASVVQDEAASLVQKVKTRGKEFGLAKRMKKLNAGFLCADGGCW